MVSLQRETLEVFMFLSKKIIRDAKIYRSILILLLAHNSSSAMFSATSKRVGEAVLPATRMVRQPSSVSNPRISMQYPSWRSTIGSMQLNWQPRRWFSSLKEMFEMKTPEDVEKYKQKVIQEKKSLSPTAAHLLHSLTRLRSWRETPKQFLERMELNNIDPDQVDRIMAEEKKFFEMGFHILYHSTQAMYYALHYIDTQLALLHKRLIESKSVPKNIPLRLRQTNNIPLLLRQTAEGKHVESEKIQQQFLKKGSESDHSDRHFLLSCNPALTGNFSRYGGECTLDYWDKKLNIHGFHMGNLEKKLNEIVEQYDDLVPYIDVFKDRINESVRRLDANLKTGVLLQLVFKDPILAQESIYVSKPWGRKRWVSMADRATNNVLDIMKAYSAPELSLKESDINEIQYRVVLTDSLLLDVFNKNIYENFEIHAYANPQIALESFHQKIKLIMKQIEYAFMEHRQEQTKNNESEL
jgi:hypothetical protein